MIAAILAFLGPFGRFLKPYAGYLLIAALVGLALWGVHHRGYREGVKHEQAAQAERVKKAQKRVKEGEKRADAITTKAETEHVRTVEKIRTVTQTIVKEIPYAIPSDPTRASLSVGFTRLHDAAATGVPGLPDPAGRADAEASGIEDAALARTLIENYEACRINAQTVTAWAAWWQAQAANYNVTTAPSAKSKAR